MNIRTSACYLAGGLYFLLFAAACTCSPSGKISGGQDQGVPVQKMEAPAAASASDNNDDMIVEGEAVESSVDGGEVMVDDGSTVVESSVSESSEGEVIEGEVVEEGSTEGTVVESSEGEVVTDSNVVESSETTVTEGGDAAGTDAGDEMMMNSPADGQPVME